MPGETTKATIRRIAGMTDESPNVSAADALKAKMKALQSALGREPTAEESALLKATIPQTETTKGTILRTTGARSTEEPTITQSQAHAEVLNVESALSNKAWMAQDARTKITEAAKTLPREIRGDFLHAVSTAKNETDIRHATERMADNLATHDLREAYARGAEIMAKRRFANIPKEFADKATAVAEQLKGTLDNVRNLPNRLRPKGEPSATAEAKNAYRDQINDYVDAIKQHVEEGRKAVRDAAADPNMIPPKPSEPAKQGFWKKTGQGVRDLASPERFSWMRRQFNHEVQATGEHIVQARKEVDDTFNGFHAKALPRDPEQARKVLANLTQLGWHNRANALRSEAFQAAINLGASHEDAVAASERVAMGIPDFGPAAAAKVKADPAVRKAGEYWLKNIAPMQEANLERSGQGVKGWSEKAAKMADPLDGLMINLPPERAGNPEHFGTRRRAYNQAEALLDETTGNSDYLLNHERVLKANIAYPIRARVKAEFARAVKEGGFAPAPEDANVRQAPDGKAYVTVNGIEHEARPVLMDDAQGMPQPHFVPKELLDVHNFTEPPREDPKAAAKLMNMYVSARLALGADVGYHVFRELGNVGAQLAGEGNAANVLPWAGGRILSLQRAYRAATMPHGDMLQLLATRMGFDRGTGFYTHENDPVTKWQKVRRFGHEILFHPQWGINTNLRRVLADSYINARFGDKYQAIKEAVDAGKMSPAEGADAAGDLLKGKGQIELKNWVNRTMGENNHLLRAKIFNDLQSVAPFIGQNIGTLPGEFQRFVVGNVKGGSLVREVRQGNVRRAALIAAGGLMSGPLGWYLFANLLNYGTTSIQDDKKGKWLWENDEGHRLTPQIAPGVFWSNSSPGDSRPARDTGVQTALNDGDWVAGAKDIPRNLLNEMLGAIPLADPAFNLVGKSPYVGRSDQLVPSGAADVNPVSTGGNVTAAIVERLLDTEEQTSWGQAAAQDVAGLVGQRLIFERPLTVGRRRLAH